MNFNKYAFFVIFLGFLFGFRIKSQSAHTKAYSNVDGLIKEGDVRLFFDQNIL